MKNLYRCWAEVDLHALRSNLAWLRHRVGPEVRMVTVVKADAYGHGLKQIAALLMQSGTDVFGVANLAEARSIRTVGRGWPILMLGACLPGEVEDALQEEVMPTLSSFEEARRFSAASRKLGRSVQVHLKIDTGMGRLGVAAGRTLPLALRIARLPNLKLCGIMTHFSSAEDDAHFSKLQRMTFAGTLGVLEKAGVVVPWVHAANSGALLLEPEAIYNMVRPGLLVYGVIPPARRKIAGFLQKHLKAALSWKCRVSLIKEIPKGTPVSYGHTFIAPRAMRVAVITAGYGDGYLRAASHQGQVLINGKRCPILGRVTMDQMVVGISRAGNVKVGDEVVLIGQQKGEVISAAELAEWCGTIPWEILTNITYRVPRLYCGGSAS